MLDDRYIQDPNNPFLLKTTISSFGGVNDVVSGQDNGLYSKGGSSVLDSQGNTIGPDQVQDVRNNPQNYHDNLDNTVAVPEEFYSSGVIKPGDPIDITNPSTGKTIRGVAGESGPSAKNRGIDVRPHMLDALGANTDAEVIINMKPADMNQADIASIPDTSLSNRPIQQPAADAFHEQATTQGDESGGKDDLSSISPDYTPNESILGDATDREVQAVDAANQSNSADQSDETAGSLGISVDPHDLTVVEKRDNGDTVFNDGSILHSNGSVTIEQDGQIVQAFPGEPKLHIVKKPEPTIHYEHDPGTGLVSAYTYKNGKIQQIPIEGQLSEGDIHIPEGATGDAALDGVDANGNPALSERDKSIIKQYASYDRPAPTGGRQNKEFNRLSPYIFAYRPDYDTTNYKNKERSGLDLSSQMPNSGGGQIASANRAIHHLYRLYELAKKLDNGQFPDLNALENWAKNHSGQPEVKAFLIAKERIDSEITRAFSGSAPDVASLNEARKQLSGAETGATYQQVLTNVIPSLLMDRIGTTTNTYNVLAGKPWPASTTPETDKIMSDWGFVDFPKLSGHAVLDPEEAAQTKASESVNASKDADLKISDMIKLRRWLDSDEAAKDPQKAEQVKAAIAAWVSAHGQ